MIRVIRGLYKGKKLKRVSSPLVRPLPDKLKEALFHVLQDHIKGCWFLDGFAGTGSAGIEALSRGAERVVFVEAYYPAVKTLKQNLEKCGPEAEGRSLILHREFNRAIIQLSKDGALFDIIFIDPPYRLLEERNPLKVIRKRAVLKEGGVVVLRRHRKTKFEGRYFELVRTLQLGDDTLCFYR